MRLAWFAAFLSALNVLAVSPAIACRHGAEPDELRQVKADSIVLVRIETAQRVGPAPDSWRGAASRQATIFGSADTNSFEVFSAGSASCEPGMPTVNEYWVLYLKKTDGGFSVLEKWPFWWARASLDPRLGRLNTILPLGIVRDPTADESAILDISDRIMSDAIRGKNRERLVHLPGEVKDLSQYTRVYSRASTQVLSVEMFRSRNPKRLVSDIREEGPTAASCKCKLYHGVVDFDEGDLQSWGQPAASRGD